MENALGANTKCKFTGRQEGGEEEDEGEEKSRYKSHRGLCNKESTTN
jgi:hypothetical protein